MKAVTLAAAALSAFSLVAPVSVADDRDEESRGLFRYEVIVTNVTRGQQFTPLLLVTHRPSLRLFELGRPASSELATLAEEGDIGPLRAALQSRPRVTQVRGGNSLTNPGSAQRFVIDARPFVDRLSLAAMLIPTNDAFVALNAIDLPESSREIVIFAVAYDAGSERNDELCSSIPGPSFVECGGPGGGARVGEGEGFVHVHNGIHGVGSLTPALRDWRNPVAQVKIRRVR